MISKIFHDQKLSETNAARKTDVPVPDMIISWLSIGRTSAGTLDFGSPALVVGPRPSWFALFDHDLSAGGSLDIQVDKVPVRKNDPQTNESAFILYEKD